MSERGDRPSDPTDPAGVGAAQAERARSSSRSGDSGSPVGSPLTIALATLAIIAGFLIFRAIDDGEASAPAQSEQTVAGAGGTTTTAAGQQAQQQQQAAGTATTEAAGGQQAQPQQRVVQGATVVVANDSGVNGAAGTLTEQLAELGYTMEEATDAPDPNSDTTTVYFNAGPPAIRNVAESVARDIGGKEVKPMPDRIPTQSGSAGSANVVVELGNDIAGQSLDEIAPERANITAPAPAGGGATETTTG